MLWIVTALFAGLLAYVLVRTLRRYEQESASAALEHIGRLEELTQDLVRRVQNLEAIVTAVDSDLERNSPDVSSSGVESTSSARRPATRSGR